MKNPEIDRTTWWVADPDLLATETASISASFPALEWNNAGAGSWVGPLPMWPFDRAEIVNLDTLLGGTPLVVKMEYGHAFPASPPSVFPLDPVPPVELRSFTEYHVLGDGSLCLLRDAVQWTTSSLTTDLLLKAAAWRIEYALFTRGKISKLSESGIVLDPCFDSLITSTITEIARGD